MLVRNSPEKDDLQALDHQGLEAETWFEWRAQKLGRLANLSGATQPIQCRVRRYTVKQQCLGSQMAEARGRI